MPNDAGTIGVVGGGQLALMLCEAGQNRGIQVAVQSASDQDPAVASAHHQVIGAPTDAAATAVLADQCDGITFENEWIPVEALLKIERNGVSFNPSIKSLKPLVNKLS